MKNLMNFELEAGFEPAAYRAQLAVTKNFTEDSNSILDIPVALPD